MRLIDADKLEKDVEHFISHTIGNTDENYAYNRCKYLIKGQPTIEPHGTWIPCSERLPEEPLRSVIGWDEYRERCVFVRYSGGEWILGNHESVKVLAWMPVPEPYKEEKQ